MIRRTMGRREALRQGMLGLAGLLLGREALAEPTLQDRLEASLRVTVREVRDCLMVAVGLREIGSDTVLTERSDGRLGLAIVQALRTAIGLDAERRPVSIAVVGDDDTAVFHRFIPRSGTSAYSVEECLRKLDPWGTAIEEPEPQRRGDFLRALRTRRFTLAENLVFERNGRWVNGAGDAINTSPVYPGDLVVVRQAA